MKQCPEFPFFGAKYPDARCIDGYLWDMDSCTESPNVFAVGGDAPCPFCNRDEFIEADPLGIVDERMVAGDCQADACIYAVNFYLEKIEKLRLQYDR